MDIKPSNMLFHCGESKLIQFTDLDDSMINGKGSFYSTFKYKQ